MFSDNKFEELYDKLIATRQYNAALTKLRGRHYKRFIKERSSDALQACTKYLTEDNYEGDLDLYCCSEELLKYVAQVGHTEEVLLELLELVETARSDNIFTTALKALQICLLRQKGRRVNGLEWSLNSIHTYIMELQLPEILQSDYDEKEERLLEEDSHVHRILMNYITISMFLEPLIDSTLSNGEQSIQTRIFRDLTKSRRNILACFILQLLGKPIALLDLSNRTESTNTYSLQCARTLSIALCRLLGDPIFLLSYAERKVRWKRIQSSNKNGVYENAPRDIFLLEEKTPILALGIFYYLLISYDLIPSTSPKIYHPLYIFEMGIYLVNELLCCEEAALQHKGILLGIKLVQQLTAHSIQSGSLDLPIHATFCTSLCNIIVYSSSERNRKTGLQLLKNYILQFDEPGKFQLIQNLIQTTKHSGLTGYLIGIYKNLLSDSLNSTQLPSHFNADYKDFILGTICTLPKDVESDLMEDSEKIFAALNILRYLAIRDKENRTGFWDFVDRLHHQYLIPLRMAIDLSKAHYKAELQQVSASKEEFVEVPTKLEVSLQTGEPLDVLTKQEQLKLLQSAMLAFDLMESLLARVQECIEQERSNK